LRIAESGGVCTFCGAKVALSYSEQSETRPAHRAASAAKGVRLALRLIRSSVLLHVDDSCGEKDSNLESCADAPESHVADGDAAASSASAADVSTSTPQTDDASSAAAVAFKVLSPCGCRLFTATLVDATLAKFTTNIADS